MSKEIRYYQKEAIIAIDKKLLENISKQLLVMATGCHAKGTKILMSNGEIKNVEDIIEGDNLMGDDSTSRNVLKLIQGNDKMFLITPTKGEAFTVNGDHILSLKRTGVPKEKEKYYPKFIEITVNDYLNLNKHKKHLYKLWRTGIDLPNIGSNTHPYWIGLWLGDGTFDRPIITIPDKEVHNWCETEFKEFCSWNHPEINIHIDYPKDRCSNINFTLPNGTQNYQKNSLLNFIRTCTSTGEKRIPDRNLRNSKENRLELLAGLLDSDGSLDHNGYEITTKYNGLADDILFLARSLGLAAYKSEKIGVIKKINFKGLYYRVYISGELDSIPCKIKRKQATERLQIKSVLVTGFKVEEKESADYYGFQLDGNQLYCMGDFTITHNSGKTFTAVEAIKNKGRVLWGTHTEELIEQSAIALLAEKQIMDYNTLLFIIDSYGGLLELLRMSKIGGMFADPLTVAISEQIGIVKADMFDIDKPIVVASMQTLYRRLDKIPKDHFKVFVLDECHYSGANTWMKSIEHFNVDLLLGLTATPYRVDGMLMGDIFDEIVYEYGIDKGVKDGYLCTIDAIRVQTGVDIDSVKTTAGELNQGQLNSVINTPVRNALIVRKYKEYCDGRQFIASCASVQHAQDLCEAFKDEGIKCDFIVGDEELTTDRKGVIKRFKSGQETGLCHVMVLTAGFDHSEVSCCLQTSPTKSLTKYLQQVGRGTRLKFGKFKDLIILDFVDTTRRHQLVNAWELDKAKAPEDRTFLSPEKKEKLMASRQAKLDLLTQTKTVDERVNLLLPLPKLKLNKSIRMKEEATQKQLDWIATEGHDILNNHYTKEMCNIIISALPAADWQIKVLRMNGYDVAFGATRGEFEMAKKEIENKEMKKVLTDVSKTTNLDIIF